MARYESVLGLIGETPLVEISTLSPNPDARLFIKLEGQNPGGSVKDRVALSMIEIAENDGILKPGQPDQILMEPSSGNTGIGLAMVCKVKGYHLKVVMPTNVSIERRQLLEVWGAEIIESPGSEGSNGAVRLAQKLAGEHPEWKFLYQYGNPANPQAHFEGTGPEILRDPRHHALRGRPRHVRDPARGGPLPPRDEGGCGADLGRRAAVGRDGGRTAQPRRRVHPTHLRRVGRRRAPGPQDRGPAPGIHRVDQALDGRGDLRRHIDGRGRGRGDQVRVVAGTGCGGIDRGGLGRWWVEVPVDGSLDRRSRRGRRASEVDHLLLTRRAFSLDAVGDGLGISHHSKLGDLRQLGAEPVAKGGEDRGSLTLGVRRRRRGGSDGVAQGVGQDADQGGHLAELDGGGGHAHPVAPMAQDDLSLS